MSQSECPKTTVAVGTGTERWEVHTAEHREIFPASAAAQASTLIRRWEPAFPFEDTWVRRQYGVPSVLVRLDCVVHDGQLMVYEVEERPNGIGLSMLVNRQFDGLFRSATGYWPDVTAVVCPRRRGGDDQVWLSQVVIGAEAAPEDGALLPRCEPEQAEFHPLAPRSFFPLCTEGDKSYGEALGLWKRVTNPDELPWEMGFALKPLQGSKAKEVYIWSPGGKDRGGSTRTRITKALQRNGAMFCQGLIRPMHGPLGWFMFRVFFARTLAGEWMCLGGLWLARQNLVMHGASDSVIGPLVVP